MNACSGMADLNTQKVFEVAQVFNVKLGTECLFELRYLDQIITCNYDVNYIDEEACIVG